MVLLKIIQNLVAVLSKTVATGHMWLLSPQNVVRAAEELNFKFYLIILNGHMFGSPGLD